MAAHVKVRMGRAEVAAVAVGFVSGGQTGLVEGSIRRPRSGTFARFDLAFVASDLVGDPLRNAQRVGDAVAIIVVGAVEAGDKGCKLAVLVFRLGAVAVVDVQRGDYNIAGRLVAPVSVEQIGDDEDSQ